LEEVQEMIVKKHPQKRPGQSKHAKLPPQRKPAAKKAAVKKK
jgi:hypothetical protein